MSRFSITRFMARRKVEAATLVVVATGAAVGMFDMAAAATEPNTTVVSSAAVPMQYLSAAAARVSAPATVARASAPASMMGLPNLEHPRVDQWVKTFTTSQRGSYATYLKRMTRYDDMISAKLAKKNMPQGLIFLAMIESGFNPTATSPVKAKGLWQFMSATGREYGLAIGRRVDQRTNPARSTDAALAYLSDLHDRFGSWYLAAAAYNTGQGRVARIMKQETGRTRGTDADYYRISSRLPQETRDYVPKMIAAARIGENPAKYGFAN